MSTDPQMVAELRALFLNGATPSRLIRHIAERHDADADWPGLVDPYFEAAFRVVPFVRSLQGPNAFQADLDHLDLSDLNGELLRDMVGRAAWKDAADGPVWCDGLAVSPSEVHSSNGVRPEADPRLTDDWPALSPRAQFAIRQAMLAADEYSQRCRVLTRLVERLQQQVLELERQSAGV